MQFKHQLQQFWRQALALVLPPQCVSCEALLSDFADPGFCPPCYGKLRAFNLAEAPALQDDLALMPFTRFAAAYFYDETLSHLVSRLKFHDGSELATPLARVMLSALHELPGADVLVPVPLHHTRLLQRKYNQAALLTKRLSKASGLPWLPQGLKRTRKTAHQTGQTRDTRLRQLQGAFIASPKVKDKHVILVDDVFTTGSTATACAKALLKAGAKQVDVLVLAYVEP